MNIACPECARVYRIDPVAVPYAGALTRCTECHEPFLVVSDPEAQRPGVTVSGRPAPAPAPPTLPEEPPPAPDRTDESGPEDARVDARVDAPAAEPPPAPAGAPSPTGLGARPAVPVFGPQEPHTRARRLARALISDIKVYNQDRWDQSRNDGSLRKDFRDEILKSWEEYVEQVGETMAKRTPYFRDALNDILAAGDPVF